MSRLERRIHRAGLGVRPGSRPEQTLLESAFRGRTARKIRGDLRRGVPLLLHAPRWSQPARFLDDLALDLAISEPGIGCRTVSFRPIQGRPLGEAWQQVLRLFAQVGKPRWISGPPRMVADRRGFRGVLRELLSEVDAARDGHEKVALLAHGAELLPLQILEDLGEVWQAYAAAAGLDRRCTLLLAGAPGTPNLLGEGSSVVDLQDYGPSEAATALVGRFGPYPRRALGQLAGFTGGIPDLVDALGARVLALGPAGLGPEALMQTLGPAMDEIRGAVDIASSNGALADRLLCLQGGEPLREEPFVDDSLLSAGLVRRVRGDGGSRVMLRAPAIAALIAC